MAAWTPERIAALRERGAALRAMAPEPDPAEQEQQAKLEAEQEQAVAYAVGLYQGQQTGYNSEAVAEFDPYAVVDPTLDL